MKLLFGKVVSNKQPKTIIVEVERFFKHPLYEKRIRRTKRYAVHTEGEHVLGAAVQFVPTRPLSAAKKWKVVDEKVNKAAQAEAQEPKVSKETKGKKGKK